MWKKYPDPKQYEIKIKEVIKKLKKDKKPLTPVGISNGLVIDKRTLYDYSSLDTHKDYHEATKWALRQCEQENLEGCLKNKYNGSIGKLILQNYDREYIEKKHFDQNINANVKYTDILDKLSDEEQEENKGESNV